MSNGNTKYGDGALKTNANGWNNSAFGICSSRDTDSSWNTSVGAYANMSNVNGISNVAVGTNSLLLNSQGSYNTALGTATLLNNLSNSNTAIGSNTMENNTTGNENVAIGVQSGYANTTGGKNTFIGTYAGISNVDGSENVFLGFNSGLNTLNTSNTSQFGNTFLGANTTNNNLNNYATAVGYGSDALISDGITLGRDNDTVLIPGKGYINSNSPANEIVTRQYVDTYVTTGINFTKPCACATTDNVNLDDYQDSFIDYVPIATLDGSRVLVKCQYSSVPSGWQVNDSTLDASNGIYIFHYNEPGISFFTRDASDCGIGASVSGQSLFVRDGSYNGKYLFRQDVSDAIVGTNNLEYVQVYQLSFELGNGLEFNGNVLNVKSNLTTQNEQPFLENVEFLGDVSVNGHFYVGNNVDVSGTLNVNSDASFNSNVDVVGNLTAKIGPDVSNNFAYLSGISQSGNVGDANGWNNFNSSNWLYASRVTSIADISFNGPFPNTPWYNLINIRHRGGIGDGNLYGCQIVTGLNEPNNAKRMAFRGQYNPSGQWTSWNEIAILNNGLSQTFASDVSFNSNVDVIGKLKVSSDASFNAFLDASSLIVRNDASFNSKIRVNGDASFNSNVDVIGKLKVNSDASFNSNVDVSGTLKVNSDASFNSFLDASSLIVRNDASFNSKIRVNGDVSFNSFLDASSLIVRNDASFNSKIRVNGDSSFNSNVDIIGKLKVNNDGIFNSNVNVSGTLNVLNSDAYVRNIRIGYGSGNNSTNTVIGYNAASVNTTGIYNTFIGWYSAFSNTTGSNNTFIGSYAARKISTGSGNIILGVDNFYGSTSDTMSNNVAIGNSSGYENNGDFNTFLGNQTGYNTDGNYNTLVGYYAGYNSSACTGSLGNTLLGSYSTISANNVKYSTAIGYGALIDTSNTIILGRNTETTKIPGKLIVEGDVSMNSKLKVNSDASFNSFLDASSLIVRNDASFNSKIRVNGDASFNSFLDASSLIVRNDASFNSRIRVNGDASFNSNVDVIGKLKVNSDVSFNSFLDASSLIVRNDASFNSKIRVNGDASFNAFLDVSSLIVRNDASFNSKIRVNGDASFNSNVDVIGKLKVNSDVSFNSFLDASSLIVRNDASFNSKIRVNGDASFNSNVDISGNVFVGKDIDCCGNIYIFDNTSLTATNEPLTIFQKNTNNRIAFCLNPDGGSYNPLCKAGDNLLVSADATGVTFNQPLTITSWSNTTNGIRISDTSLNIGVGGTSTTPKNGITFTPTQMIFDASDNSTIKFNKTLTMNSDVSANREINTSYLSLRSIASTNPLNTDATVLYQNGSASFWDNNANGGSLNIAMNDAGGTQVVTMTITSSKVECKKPLVISNSNPGNYLEFPDGTQQKTAANVFSIEYTTSQTITLPINLTGIMIKLVGKGGIAGSNCDQNSGNKWNSGGSGGGASMCQSQTIIPITSGDLSLNINNMTGQSSSIYYNTVEICRAYNGNMGFIATTLSDGSGGAIQANGSGNTTMSTWLISSGTAGSSGSTGISYQNCNDIPQNSGKPSCILTTGPFNDNVRGCGQRYSGYSSTSGNNICPNSTSVLGGSAIITYYTYYLT